MDHHGKSQCTSYPFDFHIQPSLDALQNLQLYHKLVENVTIPNSKFSPSSPQSQSSPRMSGAFGVESGGQQNNLCDTNATWSTPFEDMNMVNTMNITQPGDGALREYLQFPFPKVGTWSPSPGSEADSRHSQGSISTDLGENRHNIFNFDGRANDKAREERKLARRRERNRTSQRAFRARKEKYTNDLERHFIALRYRYETLVALFRQVTGAEAESYLNQHFLSNKDIFLEGDLES